MDEAVLAADANRQFSRLLRGVRDGHSYVVTSHGRPVGRLVPVGNPKRSASTARAALLSRLEGQGVVEGESWTRDELYARDR